MRIALPTVVSKLFELIFENRMSPHMYTSDAQFSFKVSHGTDMTLFSFKESVQIYLNSGPPVFVCFVDATKILIG